MAEDVGEFPAFAAAQARPLLRTAMALTRDFHAAQDLVQETLARMFEVWERTGQCGIDSPAAYAQTVLVRTHIGHLRRRSFWERPTADVAEREAAPPDHPELRLALGDALRRLKRRDRAVLELRFLCDRSVDQVAEDLRMTPGQVRSQTLRALGRLRSQLGADVLLELGQS